MASSGNILKTTLLRAREIARVTVGPQGRDSAASLTFQHYRRACVEMSFAASRCRARLLRNDRDRSHLSARTWTGASSTIFCTNLERQAARCFLVPCSSENRAPRLDISEHRAFSITPPLSALCEQRPFAERRGLIHQPQFFALYKETPMAFRIKPAGASGSRVCGMAASLPNEAEFGFWPPRFLKQKPVALFCFFTSPEGQLPRRGIVVIGAGPIYRRWA